MRHYLYLVVALLCLAAMQVQQVSAAQTTDQRFAGVQGEAYLLDTTQEAFRGVSGYALLLPSQDDRFAGVSGSAAVFATDAQPLAAHALGVVRLPVDQ